ncbi:hypothetical protein, partial [Caldovatus aquaticus]
MANLLFSSGFEGGVSLSAPYNSFSTGAYQDVIGTDAATGYTWPGSLWGGKTSILLLSGGGNLSSVISNTIETVTGHDGNQTRALHLDVNQKVQEVTQDSLWIQPAREPGEFYISEWVKLPANLAQQLGPGGWLAPFGEWKSVDDF